MSAKMQTKSTTALSSTSWGYHEDTQEYRLLTRKYCAKVWYHGVPSWVWAIYTHEEYFGSHEAMGRAIDNTTAVLAVEALLEIMT